MSGVNGRSSPPALPLSLPNVGSDQRNLVVVHNLKGVGKCRINDNSESLVDGNSLEGLPIALRNQIYENSLVDGNSSGGLPVGFFSFRTVNIIARALNGTGSSDRLPGRRR